MASATSQQSGKKWGRGVQEAHGLQIHGEIATLGHYAERIKEDKTNIDKTAENLRQHRRLCSCASLRPPGCVRFVQRIISTAWFNNSLLVIIFINCIMIAIDAQLGDANGISQHVDGVFLAIYSLECALKLYAEPRRYWKGGYNRFDALILALSIAQFIISFFNLSLSNLTFLRVFRSLRALRSFRSISSIRQLQVIVNALLKTLRKNVLDILACLFAFTFLFAVMGYYLFGEGATADSEYFGTLPISLFSLMHYITSSDWANVQKSLTDSGYTGSEAYSVIFMFLGNFVFTNLFIGVICENIEEASDSDRKSKFHLRELAVRQKKGAFIEKQKRDMRALLMHTDASESNNLQTLLASLAGTLRHDELVPMTHLSCNLTWLETYLTTQYHLENSMYRCQQTHFNIATTLAELRLRRRNAANHAHHEL